MATIIKHGDIVIAKNDPILTPAQQRAAHHQNINIISRRTCELKGTLSIKGLFRGETEWTDFGVVSEAIITTAAIAQLVSLFQGGSATVLQSFRYHAAGVGTTAESNNQTALISEVETRDAGTQTSISVGNYRTVAQHAFITDGIAITEHGIFSATSGGVMLDRSKFSPIPVDSATLLAYTYDLSILGS